MLTLGMLSDRNSSLMLYSVYTKDETQLCFVFDGYTVKKDRIIGSTSDQQCPTIHYTHHPPSTTPKQDTWALEHVSCFGVIEGLGDRCLLFSRFV